MCIRDRPLIIHSDRGSQYVAKEYKKATENMQRSYSKKAFPWDNACIESFHSCLLYTSDVYKRQTLSL